MRNPLAILLFSAILALGCSERRSVAPLETPDETAQPDANPAASTQELPDTTPEETPEVP